MTKRADGKFKRSKNDAYDTPYGAVIPLFPHLRHKGEFFEPCAGKGDLVRHLEGGGFLCGFASDIQPREKSIATMDALNFQVSGIGEDDVFITNPPWTREILHPLITHLSDIAPTWLLFDADWMHTKQAIPFKERCVKVVSVGRVSWMGNGVSGFDNCAWYLFDKNNTEQTRFYWRT